MPSRSRADRVSSHQSSAEPNDDFLIASLLNGDAAALRALMGRYDRLVRYTVFRCAKDACVKDPDWLESVATDTWSGFVQSLRRNPDNLPQSMAAFIARIARNQTISAVRRLAAGTGEMRSISLDSETEDVAGTLDTPAETAARIELLDALRTCLEDLDADGRAMASQLQAITDRRWRDAAGTLGISESTLRSRWKAVLGRLRACIRRKTGSDFAPLEPDGD